SGGGSASSNSRTDCRVLLVGVYEGGAENTAGLSRDGFEDERSSPRGIRQQVPSIGRGFSTTACGDAGKHGASRETDQRRGRRLRRRRGGGIAAARARLGSEGA